MVIIGSLASFTTLLPLLTLTLAQSCWKNTICSGPDDTAFPGQWQSNIYAPSSRTVSPKSILSARNREVFSPYSGSAKLSGNGSHLVFDFDIEVGGLVTFEYTSTGAGQIGIAFTEGKNWIGEWSDSSNGKFKGPDGAIYANFAAAGNGTYIMPDKKLRGGFRYMTLFLVTNSTTTVEVTNISLEIAFQPTWSNLRAYQGYFHSSDELLNRIWYSGAYTLQTNAVPVNAGRTVPFIIDGWENSGILGPGDTIIVDGAKRDRAVWPGDMFIAVPSTFVSIGDLASVKNALQAMYDNQNADGSFPEAGPPLLQQSSDTYHMWSMVGTYNYLLYSNDTTFLHENWVKYLKAMTFIYDKVGSSGLLEVTGTRDWARWQQGFNNSEANMILYHTLLTGADLAIWADDDTGLNATWTAQAAALKTAINTYCWDPSYGAFKDNATETTLHPQDANSMAVLFGAVNSSSKAQSISKNLLKNWSPIGAVSPELPGNISPFISGFEIQAHFSISQTDRGLDLIRRSWGWYINNPNGTQSTVIEGYLSNGTFGYRSSRGYDYDASYVSHSHGWSSGPTSALTEYIVGLSVTSPAGATWKLAPQFGDLSHAQGGFKTSLWKFQASWHLRRGGYSLEYNVPAGTSGQVILALPDEGRFPSISIDGRSVPGTMNLQIYGSSFSLNAPAGSHKIMVS